MIGVRQMLDDLRIEPKGVVYAGAHDGEHVAEFLDAGFAHALLIEPNPQKRARLERFASERVRCVFAALSDREGPVTYWAAPEHLDVLNSIFEPVPEHFSRDAAPFTTTLVRAVTLDALLADDPAPYNVLYMNIQGAELAALRGAAGVLGRFDAIGCEVDFVERYRNGVLHADVKAFAEQHGFAERGLWRSPDPENDYGMACFARL
jgi:FkbM family methyltransferase